jgi:hypothetical protein
MRENRTTNQRVFASLQEDKAHTLLRDVNVNLKVYCQEMKNFKQFQTSLSMPLKPSKFKSCTKSSRKTAVLPPKSSNALDKRKLSS